MSEQPLTSRRMIFRPVQSADTTAFHALLADAHVREYLCDGQVVPIDWVRSVIAESDALLGEKGVGLWLAALCEAPDVLIGFCGFRVFAEMHAEPQLLYALLEPYTGRGLATEMARACVHQARAVAGMDVIRAAVDQPNQASIRVLEKVGFAAIGEAPGAFGTTVLFALQQS